MTPLLPRELRRRFEAILFDWDGTAVASRSDDAQSLREQIEALSAAAVDLAIVTGTTLENVDRQLGARPPGPGTLLVATNRGSELFVIDATGPHCVHRRRAGLTEDRALDDAAARTCAALHAGGLGEATVVTRYNRRKIDLLPGWVDPPKAEIAALVEQVTARLATTRFPPLRSVVDLAAQCARRAGLDDARITSDAKHVEIGITDKGDAARLIGARWWAQGVGSGLVLVVGDEFGPLGGVPGSDGYLRLVGARATAVSVGLEPDGVPDGICTLPGGPTAFATLLDDQRARRRAGELPGLDDDASWCLTLDSPDLDAARANEARAALADGRIGVRAAALHGPRSDIPMTLPAGAYLGRGAESAPLPAADLAAHHRSHTSTTSLRFDLRTGVVAEVGTATEILGVRFLDPDHPGVLMLRDADGAARLVPPQRTPGEPTVTTRPDSLTVTADATSVTTAITHVSLPGGAHDHTIACATDARTAHQLLAESAPPGFDARLRRRRQASAARWADALVACPTDADLERALRFAVFHLMQSAPDDGEAYLAARGLTGPAYRGHIFWDAEVFVLPFLAATHPRSARTVLEYRYRRMGAAKHAAREQGRQGARIPWESAADGTDVTPVAARSRSGQVVPIRTGALELHNVAGVAWAVREYLRWTDDAAFAAGAGAELLVETARFWASCIRLDANGAGHIDSVIGPDEYHEAVNDNAYTNVMAAANLRWAADHAERYREASSTPTERATWRALADTLVDGFRADLGLYEAFAGFFDLEPLVIAELAPQRPIAADLFLGAARTRRAQVVKQADVLMLHHLVPELVAPGSLDANLAYYEPRTAHGSSLSPGVHAALFARAGTAPAALDLLHFAAHIDLDDITDTTAQGLHLAAMGSVWQAWVYGFLGCRATAAALTLDPRVPEQLGVITATVCFRGTRVTINADATTCTIDTTGPLTVQVNGSTVRHPGGHRRWVRTGAGWEARS